MFQGRVGDMSGMFFIFQGCFGDVSIICWGCVRDVLAMLQGCFRDVLGMFMVAVAVTGGGVNGRGRGSHAYHQESTTDGNGCCP